MYHSKMGNWYSDGLCRKSAKAVWNYTWFNCASFRDTSSAASSGDLAFNPASPKYEILGKSHKNLTNLTVIVPQVYNIEKLCFIYIKCERSELLADISRYSGILDNNLLLSRTEFLRHSGSKIRDEITK